MPVELCFVRIFILTDIDETAGCGGAELFRLILQNHLHRARMGTRRGLDFHGVRRHELTPDGGAAKHHLKALEKVVAHNDDRCVARGPAFGGADGFDTRGCCPT